MANVKTTLMPTDPRYVIGATSFLEDFEEISGLGWVTLVGLGS
jgi:hypothetical protein